MKSLKTGLLLPLQSLKSWPVLLLAIAGLGVSASSAAQDYPSKPVHIIVTYTAGGAADVSARIIADKLSEFWKQQVLVENRGGGNGSVGAEQAKRSPPDGYTLLLMAAGHVFSSALEPKLGYDLQKDFAPVVMTTVSPMLLAVNPRVKAGNMRELTALLRANPGKFDIASCGVASAHHFAAEIYKSATGTFAVHIPHRGCSPAVVDTVSGQIDIVMTSLPTALSFVRQGKLRAIGITSRERSAIAPDIPTFRESGLKELADYQIDIYYGLMAPAGTPRDITSKIEADVRRAMVLPDVKARVEAAGMDPFLLSPSQMSSLIGKDLDRFRQAIRVANIRID
jgi:tripartite-type tricarboxylate transporter receptor subunit TctC